jgi:hypothetical protein
VAGSCHFLSLENTMIPVKLIGTPTCRRYQKMRARVFEEAERQKLAIQVEEVGDTETLSKFNPLSLPRLYIRDVLVASQNPPKAKIILQALNGNIK